MQKHGRWWCLRGLEEAPQENEEGEGGQMKGLWRSKEQRDAAYLWIGILSNQDTARVHHGVMGPGRKVEAAVGN
jgi:hypothetical protein